MEVTNLKRVVIKEELVAITGDFISAIILNQFMYWSDRVKDFDKLLLEEKTIAEKEGIELNAPLKQGWIYKKAEELIDETMLGISASSMRNKIKSLVEQGYLFERKNPYYKWDHTKQYRVNYIKIKNDLEEKGYALQGYRVTEKILRKPGNIESQNLWNGQQLRAHRNSEIGVQNSEFGVQNSEFEEQYQRLQTENKPENKEKKEYKEKKEKNELQRVRNKIDSLSISDSLKTTILKYMKHRIGSRQPVTTVYLDLMLDQLETLSQGNEQVKIKIIEQAINNGYRELYPLKENNRYNRKDNRLEVGANYDMDEYEAATTSDDYFDNLPY